MKRSLSILLILFMMIGSALGCDGKQGSHPVPSEAAASEPDDAEPSDDAEAGVVYDASTQTLSVRGIKDYVGLSLPAEIEKARVLQVTDDDFSLSAFLPLLRDANPGKQIDLPEILDRTANSLRFIKRYLYENAGDAYPDALAEKQVLIKIDRKGPEYCIDDDQITLFYFNEGTHREFLYLLALQNSEAVGWEQIGYAWYVGTCKDPYSEVLKSIQVTPELAYYSYCIAAGVDPSRMSASDFRILYDACSRVCFDKDLTHWGSYCESAPAASESVFTRKAAKEPGDTELSAFMAASFLAWLDDAYSFEQVSMFCFGQKSFNEAFGTDFRNAFEAWRAWIVQTYTGE